MEQKNGFFSFSVAKKPLMCYNIVYQIKIWKYSMKTIFYLVRHGQSMGNLENRMLGHSDEDLSELGYRQAAITFEYMKERHVDAVYSSPLLRAMHTAAPHAAYRGLEVHPLDELKEIYLGEWEGMNVADVIHRWPYTFWELWRANFGVCTPPKGEYVQDAADRVLAVLTRLGEAHPGQTLLIGGHAGIFRAVIARIAGILPERVGEELPYPSNASVSTVEYENGKFSLVRFSEDAHLAELSTNLVNM